MRFLKLIAAFFILLNTTSLAQTVQLNEAEKEWLANHPEIRIAYDKNFPPFEWKNKQGQYKGISIDYLRLIENKLNIKFIPVEKKNWSEILQSFKAGEIDILPAIAKNENRQKMMLFTESHISTPGVIISASEYTNVSELFGKKVGVVIDYFWEDIVNKHDEKIDIIRVESTERGIELTATGAIDAMVSDLASVSYIIQKDGISNLHVVPMPRNEKLKLELRIGIRNDWPQLRNILQKTLDSINQQEKETINNKWIKLQKIAFWQSRSFWTTVIIISIIVLTVIMIILVWNHSLKLQVARRSEQLEKAQAQLIHAEKMESIGRLSAGVAHEVKNPLAILQMSIDYLKGEDNDETIETILTDMEDAVSRADRIIKGLLDFSREKELQVIDGNINKVIQQSLKLIGHELKQNKIELKTELADDLPLLAMDKNRLQQVLINLFMNAVQAINSVDESVNKELKVSSQLGQITEQWLIDNSDGKLQSGQPVIIIRILDSGCGLNQEDEKKVFDPFFTTKPLGEGTGLGLSVSKTIINLHHGMIAMRNRIDSDSSGAEVVIVFTLQGNIND